MPAISRGTARLALVGTAFSFGLMAVLSRKLSQGPDAFTPGQLSVVRFAVGVLVSLAAFRIRPGLYAPRNRKLLLLRGLSGGVVVILYFFALSRIPAAPAGMLYNLYPVLATGFAVFALGERPTVHLLLGLLLATLGVWLMLGHGGMPRGLGTGELSALASAVFAAISANLIRGMRGTDNAPTIFYWFCLAGLPVVAPFALDPWPSGPVAWALAVCMGFSAFAAQLLMTEAYGALNVSEAAVWLQLTPVAQMLMAAVALGEAVTPAAVAGVLLGVAGVAYGSVLGSRRAPAAALPPEPPG